MANTGVNFCSSNARLFKGTIPAFLKPLIMFVGVVAFVKASLLPMENHRMSYIFQDYLLLMHSEQLEGTF